jgi:hypothetical protein
VKGSRQSAKGDETEAALFNLGTNRDAPADVAGFSDRGRGEVGRFAGLVLFDGTG